MSIINLTVCLFLVATLTEKQKRLLEVESIKEDASTNYVSFYVLYIM